MGWKGEGEGGTTRRCKFVLPFPLFPSPLWVVWAGASAKVEGGGGGCCREGQKKLR